MNKGGRATEYEIPHTYSYDGNGNGNLTKKEWDGGQTNYVYDWRNKLRKVYNGAVSGLPDLEYAYDYAGNRFAKAEKTGSNDFSRLTFLIDNNNLTGYSQTLLEINHSTGAIDKRYEYGDDLYCQVTSPETPNPSAETPAPIGQSSLSLAGLSKCRLFAL